MFPLGDASRSPHGFPTVTAVLILANAFVFVLELAGGDRFILAWALVPAEVSSGQDLSTILTSMFLHEGWSHIIGNMIFLWAFGPEIEDAMGGARYLVFYLLGGIAAMLAQVAADPASTLPNLGASGAIAAVMGAFLVTFPRDRIKTLIFFGFFARITLIPAAFLIGFWFLLQLVSFGAVHNVRTGGVAYLAHIGGAVFGAVACRLFEDRRRVEGRY
ncbi:MAG TPA: rhomboid family intramembrane serine protease [Alphaproteobacteria bacterium]|nr:rhomboid family intramembrane serine protease [Alphaproteobacteria bacterium]